MFNCNWLFSCFALYPFAAREKKKFVSWGLNSIWVGNKIFQPAPFLCSEDISHSNKNYSAFKSLGDARPTPDPSVGVSVQGHEQSFCRPAQRSVWESECCPGAEGSGNLSMHKGVCQGCSSHSSTPLCVAVIYLTIMFLSSYLAFILALTQYCVLLS